jgi:hypothetical protein
MELFLNILWVLMALAGASVWRMRWTRQPRAREHDAWRQWTAFASAMVLLFFVVSLTDDLHAQSILYEEYSSSRRHTACLACTHGSPPQAARIDHGPNAAIQPPGSPANSMRFCTSIVQVLRSIQLAPPADSALGRAPPSVNL